MKDYLLYIRLAIIVAAHTRCEGAIGIHLLAMRSILLANSSFGPTALTLIRTHNTKTMLFDPCYVRQEVLPRRP